MNPITWLVDELKKLFQKEKYGRRSSSQDVALSMTIIFYFVFMLYLSKYIWNTSARKLVPALGKCDSVVQILGISVLLPFLLGK